MSRYNFKHPSRIDIRGEDVQSVMVGIGMVSALFLIVYLITKIAS